MEGGGDTWREGGSEEAPGKELLPVLVGPSLVEDSLLHPAHRVEGLRAGSSRVLGVGRRGSHLWFNNLDPSAVFPTEPFSCHKHILQSCLGEEYKVSF